METRKTGKNKFDLCKFMKQQRKKRESHERLVEVERELCVARKQLETKSKSLKRIKTKVEEAIREKEEIRTELDQEVPRKKARFMSDHSAKMRREKPSQYKDGQSNSQLIVKWDSTSVPFPKVIRDRQFTFVNLVDKRKVFTVIHDESHSVSRSHPSQVTFKTQKGGANPSLLFTRRTKTLNMLRGMDLCTSACNTVMVWDIQQNKSSKIKYSIINELGYKDKNKNMTRSSAG
ncbi:hypothetical protein QZH41_007728 [Actinostola sp. cb2023]|nr:hypothetical protein QZH41_007728 [Actinostola sp. cb2023]